MRNVEEGSTVESEGMLRADEWLQGCAGTGYEMRARTSDERTLCPREVRKAASSGEKTGS